MDVTRKRIDRLVHQAPGLRFSDVVALRHVVASVALALVLMATSYVATTGRLLRWTAANAVTPRPVGTSGAGHAGRLHTGKISTPMQ